MINRRSTQSLMLATLFVLSLTGSGLAQNNQSVAADTLLPSLAPKEVEVLGELEFQFPELRRPALSGFNPPPPVFEVPAGRRPYVGDYKQSGSDLPASILRKPEPPAVEFAVSPVEYQGYTRLGYGRFGTSDVGAALSLALSESIRLNFDGDHFGYRNFAIPSDTTKGDIGHFLNSGKISLDGVQGANTWSLYATGQYNRLDLNGYPRVGALDTSILSYPDRELVGLDVGAKFESAYAVTFPYSVGLKYGGTRIQTKTRGENFEQDPRLRRAQKELSFDMDLGYASDLGDFAMHASSSSLAFDRDEFIKQDHTVLNFDLVFRREYSEDLSASLGLAYLGFANFDNIDDPSSEENVSGGNIAPVLNVDWIPNSRARAYLKNIPRIKSADLREMHRINPYQESEPIHKAEYSIINSVLGLDLYSKRFALNFYGGFERVNNLQTYVSSTGSGVLLEPFSPSVLYVENSDVGKLGTELTAFMTGSLSLNANVEYRISDDIPYFPNMSAVSRLSWVFDESKGHVSLLGSYVGKRMTNTEVNQGVELSGFINLGVESSYFFSRNLGFYLSAKNLSSSDNEYWSGYFEPTFDLYGGVKLRW